MFRNIIIVILALGLVGTSFWVYDSNQKIAQLEKQVENNYQRAFNNFNDDINAIHETIGTTLAMNSRHSLSPALTEVWRITYNANTNLAQLPMGQVHFNQTEAFLTDIGAFAYRTSGRDLDEKPLTEEERNTLASLYKRAGDMLSEIQKVQNEVATDGLKWSDIEAETIATSEDAVNSQIVDGFKSIEKDVAGYDVGTDLGTGFQTADKQSKSFENATGETITKEEAASMAQNFIGVQYATDVKVTTNKEGSPYGFYSVHFVDSKTGITYTMDLTKKGGHPIYYLSNRKLGTQKASVTDAAAKAELILKQRGLTDLQLIETAQQGSSVFLTYTHIENDVRIYPDTIKVKMALDVNKVMAFTAADYVENNKPRTNLTPTLTEAEASAKISPSVQIMEHHLSVITTSEGEEALCHEFLGTVGRDTYRIFINAETGEEELVEQMKRPSKM